MVGGDQKLGVENLRWVSALWGPLGKVARKHPFQGLRTTFPWVFWGFHGK